ncbi:MAG: hypothetical protein JW829_21470 [Pirellulales bacterium]|nr:hypothetical protein [Pirellulales bacterium]
MAYKKLGMVHTSAALVPMFEQLCQKILPEIDLFHITDDSLIKDVIERNALTPATSRRVVEHIASAESAGADYILVTCSSIGPAVEAAIPLIGVPVLRVDQPMADHAVKMGGHIGVIATLPTTLAPTADLIRRRAAAAGVSVEITERLCEGAFQAWITGDTEKHDAMVQAALKELAGQTDVIALAQASMARVVERLDDSDRQVPILASPPLAIDYLKTIL